MICAILLLVCNADAERKTQTFTIEQEVTKPRSAQHATGNETPLISKNFTPEISGVIYEMSEKGLVVISPFADKKQGYGERFLTLNPFTRTGSGTSADDLDASLAEYGGIKLIGFDF